MSDMNDARTEAEVQKTVAQTALAQQIGSLADYLSATLDEPVDVRIEDDRVLVSLSERGTLTFRKGSDIDTDGVDRADVDRIELDENVQSELDAVYRLMEQLDAIEIRSRELGEDRSRRP